MISGSFIDKDAILNMAKHHKRRKMKGGVVFTKKLSTKGGWPTIDVNYEKDNENPGIDDKFNEIKNIEDDEDLDNQIDNFISTDLDYKVSATTGKRMSQAAISELKQSLINYIRDERQRRQERRGEENEREREEELIQEIERERREQIRKGEENERERAQRAREEARRIIDERIQQRLEEQEEVKRSMDEQTQRRQRGVEKQKKKEERENKAIQKIQKTFRGYESRKNILPDTRIENIDIEEPIRPIQRRPVRIGEIKPEEDIKKKKEELEKEKDIYSYKPGIHSFERGTIGKLKSAFENLKQRSKEYIPEPHIVDMLEKTIDEYEKNIQILNETIQNYENEISKSDITEEDKKRIKKKIKEYKKDKDDYERQLPELKNRLNYFTDPLLGMASTSRQQEHAYRIGHRGIQYEIEKPGLNIPHGIKYENIMIRRFNKDNTPDKMIKSNDGHPYFKNIIVKSKDGKPTTLDKYITIDTRGKESNIEIKNYNTDQFNTSRKENLNENLDPDKRIPIQKTKIMKENSSFLPVFEGRRGDIKLNGLYYMNETPPKIVDDSETKDYYIQYHLNDGDFYVKLNDDRLFNFIDIGNGKKIIDTINPVKNNYLKENIINRDELVWSPKAVKLFFKKWHKKK